MKNTVAVLVRVMEQAVRDGIVKVNPARVTGRQKLRKQAEDELLDPRALALSDWETFVALAHASWPPPHDQYRGWGDVVIFAACTAARIGEVSGCRVEDIGTAQWIWTVRRRTTPAPGGLTDKATKGERARKVPIVEEISPLVAQRILSVGPDPDARLFTGPRGGRISTAVVRDARVADHHPALPAPGRTRDHGRRGGALRTLQRAARTALAAESDRRDPLTSVKDAGPQERSRAGFGYLRNRP